MRDFQISPLRKDTRAAQRALQELLSCWLRLGGLTPRVELDGHNRFEFQSGLFGALALQLVLNATKTGNYAFCDHCHSPYSPDRSPREGQGHYCRRTECQKAAQNIRADRSRLKKRTKSADDA